MPYESERDSGPGLSTGRPPYSGRPGSPPVCATGCGHTAQFSPHWHFSVCIQPARQQRQLAAVLNLPGPIGRVKFKNTSQIA
jgi:hypothetical protein